MSKVYDPHVAMIRDAIAGIEEDRPATKEASRSSHLLQDAILIHLHVIGENLVQIRRLDEDAFADVADDTWVQVIELRNVISHGYHTIKLETIWQTITEDLPALSESLDRLEGR